MIHDKKVTILLAAYRGGAYVGAQIESILKQDEEDFFLILSDDGEETADILEYYARAYPEKILHHRSGKRFGSAQKHFMYLIARFGAEAPYTMCSDQDDIWHPDKLSLTLAAMEEAESASGGQIPLLVHTDLRVVDGDLKELDPSFMHYSRLEGKRLAFHQLLVQNVVTGCTMMLNRPLAALAARAEGEEAMLMHDWWLALTASALGKAVFLPEATMDYRQHGRNVVGAKRAGSLSYLAGRLLDPEAEKMRD
ncbi:MAG: glycosyltransferase family 2 protein, partial [Lachnospiraceae bacterium]|nr:glycosyltransferase family 2 protein [Lachnospiraceae bacterium]